MAFVNYSTREINVKIVYYGPGLCGKTANLQYLYSRAPSQSRGRLISLATETERTLFFDFLPMNLGVLHGFKVRFHLYTVPGQVFYEASRKLILKGVDGLLFVADSDPLRLDANGESWEGLQRNLAGYGLSVPPLPVVIQYNKRDLPGALPVEELRDALGNPDLPQYQSVATDGTGVFESLKALAKGVLNQLQNEKTLRTDRTGFAADQAATAAAAPAPTVPPASMGGASRPQAPNAHPPPAGRVTAAPKQPLRSSDGAPGRTDGAKTVPLRSPRPSAAQEPVSKPAVNPNPRPAPPAPSVTTAGAGAPPSRSVGNPDGPVTRAQGSQNARPAAESGPEPVKRRGFGWFRRSR